MQITKVIDIIIGIVLISATISGFIQGIVMKAAQFIALIVSWFTAYLAANILSDMFSGFIYDRLNTALDENDVIIDAAFGTMSELAGRLSYLLIYVTAFLIVYILSCFLVRSLKILDHLPVFDKLNHICGAVAGFLIDFIVICIICSIIFKTVPQVILDNIGLTKNAVESSLFLSVFAED